MGKVGKVGRPLFISVPVSAPVSPDGAEILLWAIIAMDYERDLQDDGFHR